MTVVKSARSGFSFAARIGQFSALLEQCQITCRDGKNLDLEPGLTAALAMILGVRERGGHILVIGNGGSAAIAAHVVNDLVNVGEIRALTVHDSALLTCMANDYGYENAYARAVGRLAEPGDLLIAISSSGRSRNICNAAERMKELGGSVLTLSGFAADNPLRSLGAANIWLDAADYGLVEVGHQFILHELTDRCTRAYR